MKEKLHRLNIRSKVASENYSHTFRPFSYLFLTFVDGGHRLLHLLKLNFPTAFSFSGELRNALLIALHKQRAKVMECFVKRLYITPGSSDSVARDYRKRGRKRRGRERCYKMIKRKGEEEEIATEN